MAESLRYLSIVAHPDDLDFGCAGTTAVLTSSGNEVIYCLVTSGEAGGSDSTISRPQMASIRQDEQRAAAKVVGVTELHFLGFPDGAVESGLELRKALARVIRQVRPDRVLAQSPQRNFNRMYGSHPDHLAVGESTLNAVYPDARNQFAFPELLADEGLEPHTVSEVWLMGGPKADHYVDITDTFEKKMEALLCHKSQIADPEQMTARLRERSEAVGVKAGFGEGRMAEAFRRLDTA